MERPGAGRLSRTWMMTISRVRHFNTFSYGGQKISPYQKNQTFPSGSDVYPFDRPILSRQHFEVSHTLGQAVTTALGFTFRRCSPRT